MFYSLSLALKHSGSSENVFDYLQYSLAFSSTLASATALITLALNAGLLASALAFVAVLIAALAFFYFLPFRSAWMRAQELEAELAFALKHIAVCLDCGVSFEKTLESASRGKSAFARELKASLQQARSGSGIRSALASFSERMSSHLLKRALLQLVNAYEIGSAAGLRRLASEATALQLSRTKEFGAKQAFYSVFFITASAVVPAAFAAFATIGSVFLSFEITPSLAFAAFALGFPSLNALLLALLYAQAPKKLFST